ncbi:MAG: CPBP family intramembrane metalloprotease [Clostridiales bacterium]|nr:CPBP family intramembrane metalloprotease [Clostridiales bacterium]
MTKKQIGIFSIVAFAIPVLLGILMAIVFKAGNTTGIFTATWMFLPASGVMLGQLLMKKQDKDRPALPKGFIITFLVTTVVMIGLCFAALFFNGDKLVSVATLIFLASSIASLITLGVAGKERRKAYGLNFPKPGRAILVVLLFIALYFALLFGSIIIEQLMLGEAINLSLNLGLSQYLTLASLIPSLFVMFTPYFGEEYGWRYFLGPILQKKFGKRTGIIILGVIWGLWHLPINIFFYSPDTALQSILQQVIGCVAFAAFFTWAYMKTDGNIWALSAIHFLNNNIGGALLSSDGSNREVTWQTVLVSLVIYAAIFLPFLLAKEYSKKKDSVKLPA